MLDCTFLTPHSILRSWMSSSSVSTPARRLAERASAACLMAIGFCGRLHTLYSLAQGHRTPIMIDILLTTSQIWAFLSVSSTMYLDWKAREAMLAQSFMIRLPIFFSGVSMAFLAAATFVVHYKAMGIAGGTFVLLLLTVTSSTMRKCCAALVDLYARIRGALRAPVQSQDSGQCV